MWIEYCARTILFAAAPIAPGAARPGRRDCPQEDDAVGQSSMLFNEGAASRSSGCSRTESRATPPGGSGRKAREQQGMTAEPVKRSQYFSPPSTECPHSSRNHFEDWQEFHLPMARMHHAELHGRGVASGLAVSVQDGGTQSEVGPGRAIDGNGELITRAAAGQADAGGEQPGETGEPIDPPFRLGVAGREPGTYYLCIQFAQALRFGEGSCGKLEQTPILRLLPSAGDDGPIRTGAAI